jgi:hypothetical protein
MWLLSVRDSRYVTGESKSLLADRLSTSNDSSVIEGLPYTVIYAVYNDLETKWKKLIVLKIIQGMFTGGEQHHKNRQDSK